MGKPKSFLDNIIIGVRETFREVLGAGRIKRKVKKPKFIRKKTKTKVTKRQITERRVKEKRTAKKIRKEIIVFQATMPVEEKKEAVGSGLNDAFESAPERVKHVVSDEVKKKEKKSRQFYDISVNKAQRHLLFMNPGTDKINQAIAALSGGGSLPVWTSPFVDHLTVKDGKLLFDGLVMADQSKKRVEVKRTYFDPRGPSTILPICDKLREKYANISKSNVRNILRSLETYQRNFARRRPPKIMGRMAMKRPGIVAIDMFFPTKKIAGWQDGSNCLTCMDCWSRFCHIYVTETKKKEVIRKCFDDFLQKLAAHGWMPRRILADKGTDLSSAKQAIEKYRIKKDGNQPMVVHSQTAQPINIVESMNSQVQKRMQVFRTSKLTDDPSRLLEDISFALNNQKRPGRGNLTPLQLLSLSEQEVRRINEMFEDTEKEIPEIKGLKKLNVGDSVRVLEMTRKQQAANTIKGFTAKWSKNVYTVLKKLPIPKNKLNFRYWVGLHQSYFRHELLAIPKVVDREVYDLVSKKQTVVVGDDENWSDLESEYDPDEYSE